MTSNTPMPDAQRLELVDDLFQTNGFNLMQGPEGYWEMGSKGAQRGITNFTLDIYRVFLEEQPNTGQTVRTAVMAYALQDGKRVGNLLVEETAWSGRADFLRAFSGVGNLGFYGKEDDVLKLRTILMTRVNDRAEQVKRVHSFGIHRDTVGDEHVLTYVEPNYSLDSDGRENTYALLGVRPPNAPALATVPYLEQGDRDAEEVMKAYFDMNVPDVMAPLMQFVAACFLKRHIETFRMEFPLLNVYGIRGCGKTQGVMRLCELFGVDYGRSADVLMAPSLTNFALWKAGSSSETAPIILDEFNVGPGKLTRQRQGEQAEYLKSHYQRGVVSRGTVRKGVQAANGFGAELSHFTLCAPVIYCAEHPTNEPAALADRSIQVMMRHSWTAQHSEQYFFLNKKHGIIKNISKTLYSLAINTPVEEVEEEYYRILPTVTDLHGLRQQHAYAALLLGNWWWGKVAETLGWDLKEVLETHRDTLYRQSERAGMVAMTEVDMVLRKFAQVADLIHDDSRKHYAIIPGLHYVVTDGMLWFASTPTYSAYVQFMQHIERERPHYPNEAAFVGMLKQTEGYVGERIAEVDGRKVLMQGVSLDAMRIRDIPVDSFVREE